MDRVTARPYSHVTDAERYRPLHRRARLLVERLESMYDVTIDDDDPDLQSGGHPVIEVVRLVPADGAPSLAIGFTDFPGLDVRLGTDRKRLPVCGCDACDEDVADLFAELEHDVHRLTLTWPRKSDQVSSSVAMRAYLFPATLSPREVVDSHLAAFNAHDTEELLATFSPSAVWITGQDRFAGAHALRELFDAGLWELDPHLDVREILADGDQVAAQLVETITVNGTPTTFPIAVFFEVRDGKIARGKVYREGSADLA